MDVITGGSPCQDLSIAGNRKGLAGERSGLFMEQIRIIKEMREADRKRGRSGEFVRCRYAVWENVGGSFSSNKGRDFQAVLTEFVRVAEPDAPDVPMPDKGKWPKSGCLYDEMGRWSVAWRMHDAQFWGVPQRRKRIALVADFGGSQPHSFSLTLNIGEKPREPMPTKLSQILEEEADQKYRLSARACQGIINRAERRGKELPKELKEALVEQVRTSNGSQEIRDGARLEMDGTEILPPEPSASRNAPENLGGQGNPYPG